MSNSYLNLLGLAYRARKISTGEQSIIKDIQSKRAKLVLIATDIGEQTKKKITDKCHSYNIPYEIVDNRDILGNAIGKSSRVAVAILDDGFANKIRSMLL